MLVTEVNESLPGGSSLLRNEPVQARSNARLTGLLDAAAAIIDEIGFERLTTAMVAERAGASIGTVYRYFPDRIAVVEALAIRSGQRLVERVASTLPAAAGSDDADSSTHADSSTSADRAQESRVALTWSVAVDHVVDALVEMYRSEPGFRAIRFADSESLSLDNDERPVLADQVAGLLTSRMGVERTGELDFVLEVATETAGALVARAFTTESKGDERFIAEARAVVGSYLERSLAS